MPIVLISELNFLVKIVEFNPKWKPGRKSRSDQTPSPRSPIQRPQPLPPTRLSKRQKELDQESCFSTISDIIDDEKKSSILGVPLPSIDDSFSQYSTFVDRIFYKLVSHKIF